MILISSDIEDWEDYENEAQKETAAFCPEGTFLNGFQLKVQPSQGKGNDDTATNDIRLFCNGTELRSTYFNSITFGNWSSIQMCPENQFIRGFTLQIEKFDSNFDNTALNNVRMSCS